MVTSGPAQTRSFSPLTAAFLVDLVDLITFGPLGIRAGLLLGALAGFVLAPSLGFEKRRWLPALLAGVYCMVPGTAVVPLAAALTGLRLLSAPREPAPPVEGEREEPTGSIDANYRSSWDEDPKRPPD